VENFYNRVENLDELIRSVKLPYLAWKVLFLVNKNADSSEISKLLEANEAEVSASLDLLLQNALITVEGDSAKAEAVQEPDVEEVSETLADETETDIPEFEEPEATVIPEEEISAEPEIENESNTEADSIEEAVDDVSELEEETLVEDAPTNEVVEPDLAEVDKAEEEFRLDTPDEPEKEAPSDVLDELLEEAEGFEDEDILEPALEELDEKAEAEESIEEEQVDEKIEEEKIEINIPEGDEEDMEFNFNLTGDDADQTVAKEAEEEEIEEPTPQIDTSGFKKILVIDDSLVIRKMVEIALEEEELIIETAVSGKEGLEMMDQTNPDLVILDMMLPDINGIEILKTIKASKGIPVIMLSGKDSPQMIETAKNEGAEEFLPKPFKDDDLVEKIKKLI